MDWEEGEEGGGAREGIRGTYQLVGLLEGPLRLRDGRLARLARQLGDLVELLLQVGLHDLELCLVRGEELGAGVGVERVRHVARCVRSFASLGEVGY